MRTSIRVLLMLLPVILSTPVSAGSGAGAILYSYNTSARFESMGSAGVGAPWGGATNQWANPAQLAYRRGLHLEWARYELAVGLADDIVLKNNELILGYRGITLTWGMWPASGLLLDMGDQQATDENGVPVGTFSSYMKSSSYGLGVDVVQVWDLIRSQPEGGGLSRYVSVSFGYVRKNFEDKLSDSSIVQDPQGEDTATANTYDFGWTLRATPLNTLDTEGPVGFLAGVAYGASTLNGGDEQIHHADAVESDPLPRAHLDGWSLHGEIALGRRQWREAWPGFMTDLYETFNPLLSLTYTTQENVPGYRWDVHQEQYVYEKNHAQRESGHGWEIGLANLFYLRKGHIDIPYLDHEDDTSGWGANLQIKKMFGARFDEATVPQPWGQPDAVRRTWSFWVDPLAIMAD